MASGHRKYRPRARRSNQTFDTDERRVKMYKTRVTKWKLDKKKKVLHRAVLTFDRRADNGINES